MSSLTAGKIQADTLNVAGLGAGAIKTRNLNFTNLDVSGNLTVKGAAVATQAFVSSTVDSLVNGAPGVLNTLGEIATALGNDANLATTLTNSIATKANASDVTAGLALKANASDVTSGLSLKADASDLTSGLALKANAADLTSGLALKANLAAPSFTGTVSALDLSVAGTNFTSNIDYSRTYQDANVKIIANAKESNFRKYKYIFRPTGETVVSWDSSSNDLVYLASTTYFSSTQRLFYTASMDPLFLDVGDVITTTDAWTRRHLVQWNQTTGQYEPDLATAIGTASNGNLTWTYTMTSGVLYENGVEVRPDDIKYAVSREFDPFVATGFSELLDASGYKGPYDADQSGRLSFDDAVVVSGNTITFNFKTPVLDCNSYLLAIMPIPEAYDTPDRYWRPVNEFDGKFNPLSCGPYKNTVYNQTGFVYERNTYWDSAKDTTRKQSFDRIYVLTRHSRSLANTVYEADVMPNAVSGSTIYASLTNSSTGSGRFNGRFVEKEVFKGINDFALRNPTTTLFDESIFVTMMALPIGPDQLNDINARKAVFFATNFQGFIDNQGGSVAGTLIDSLLKTTTIDYAPTTGNIHDPSFNILGNSAAALHYMSLLQTSNPALYTRMTTTGIRMLCYPNNNKAYDSMVASLAAIGVPLTVEYKTKNEVFYNPPISQGTDAGALFQDPRYDIIVSGWGSYTLLNHIEFLMYPGQLTTNYMGNMMRPGAGGVIGATPIDSVYQTMLDKIDAAHAATTLADKYLRTQEAVQICMDNCYIIFPFNTNTWMSWGSFTKNSKLEVTGLGPNFRDTVYNS